MSLSSTLGHFPPFLLVLPKVPHFSLLICSGASVVPLCGLRAQPHPSRRPVPLSCQLWSLSIFLLSLGDTFSSSKSRTFAIEGTQYPCLILPSGPAAFYGQLSFLRFFPWDKHLHKML